MSSTLFTDQFLDSLAPLLAYDANGHLLKYLTSLASLADPIAGIVSDQGDDPQAPIAQTSDELADGQHYMPSWGTLLDPDLCPAQYLPWLAQFCGASIPIGADEATTRAVVKDESGLRRGTVGSIVATVKRYLSGTQFVSLIERRGGTVGVSVPNPNRSGDWPYHMMIATKSSESGIPIGTYTAADAGTYQLLAAIEAVKPAGIQITYYSVVAFPWDTAIHTWSADAFSWDAAANTQP